MISLKKIKSWQSNPTLAHIVPFFSFMAFLPLVGVFQLENELEPWWRQHPEHWIYPVQTVFCALLLVFFRKHYAFNIKVKTILLGCVVGFVGIALWILPSVLYRLWDIKEWVQPEWVIHNPLVAFLDKIPLLSFEKFIWWEMLGLAERKEGFDPTIFNGWSFGLVVVFRLLRMTVIVALVEEIFWRGFLMRYLIDMDRDFKTISFGSFQWTAFLLTAFFFALGHQPVDWLAAIIWGVLVGWLAVKTRSLFACVVCHAVSNLLLGAYVLRTGEWGFW